MLLINKKKLLNYKLILLRANEFSGNLGITERIELLVCILLSYILSDFDIGSLQLDFQIVGKVFVDKDN